jgi:hypothetical protein
VNASQALNGGYPASLKLKARPWTDPKSSVISVDVFRN